MASSANRRLLAVWLPQLPIDRIRRSASSRARAFDAPDEPPLVVVGRIANALTLTAVDGRAAALGLVPGLTLADARARIPVLGVVEADEAADAALLEAIADWCDRFTPLVALDAPDGLVLDITGAAHLAGGERAVMADLRRRLATQGLTATAAIAGTWIAAHALARFAGGTIAPPGEDAAAVAPLPARALGADAAATRSFVRAGLKTIGDIAARGRSELAARFGADLVARLDQAFGRLDGPISPRRPVPDYVAERRFPEPIATADVIQATILKLAKTLSHLLEQRQEGARRLEASFFRADGAVRRIAVETGRPVRDPAALARLFRERLEVLADPIDPGFGFDMMRLAAAHAEPLAPEAVSLDADAAADGAVDGLVDRLAARFGASRVLRFSPQDTHIPEAEAVLVAAQRLMPPVAGYMPREAGEPPRRPIRLFETPEPIEAVAEVPDGPPIRFKWRRVMHRVARAEGPERIAMEWWRQGEPIEPPEEQESGPAKDETVIPGEDRKVRGKGTHGVGRQRMDPLPSPLRGSPGMTGEPEVVGPKTFPPKTFPPNSLTRDYFRVEDQEGRRFWLYRDGIFGHEAEHPRWFVHGLFA